MLTLARRLRKARTRRQHSQAEAAAAMGVSIDGYWKWEQGTRTPTGLYLKAVQDYIKPTLRPPGRRS